MIRKIVVLSLLASFLSQCAKQQDPFLISADAVGKLSKDAYVSELDSIFSGDSLVNISKNNKFSISGQAYFEVYEKGGKQLLSITPKKIKDSLQRIQNIQIYDERFTTDKGISLKSNFGEIKNNYKIKNVVTTLQNIIITLENSDVYFTISKKELPEDLRYGDQKIEVVQIPDETKVKYMMVDLSLRAE
jgi:hypothetical protein